MARRSRSIVSASRVALLIAVAAGPPAADVLAASAHATNARAAPVSPGAPPRPAHARPAPAPTPRALAYSPSSVVVLASDDLLSIGSGGRPAARDARVAVVLAAHGLDQARRLGSGAWLLTSRRPGFDPIAASRDFRATGAVKAASPNYRFRFLNTTPDDIYLIYQYYIDDGGFADVRLPQAWDVARGDTTVAIAILDTGVDTGHSDLASQIWHNPGEVAGNGLDDDGNGFTDDAVGWDFGTNDNDPNPEYLMDPSGLDIGFHGTFCAGIAAAATNNGDGIAGAGWNCRIMPLKVANPDSGLTSSAIAGAVGYAVANGASVISMSFGGPGDPGVPEFFQELVDRANFAGVLCVAAAGNDSTDVPVYPAACDRVLAVGATDDTNGRAFFSNYGPWVDVAAPGAAMWSTILRNYELSPIDQLFYLLFFGWDGLNPYMYGDGTSFACPLVAGVCGLVRARYPGLTPETVIQQVIATGDAVAFDHPIGVKLNAYRAVTLDPTAVAEGEHAPPRAGVRATPNPASRWTTIRFHNQSAGNAKLSIFDASGRRVRLLAQGPMAAGPHAIPWDGTDDRGRALPAAVYFTRLEVSGASLRSKVVLLGR